MVDIKHKFILLCVIYVLYAVLFISLFSVYDTKLATSVMRNGITVFTDNLENDETAYLVYHTSDVSQTNVSLKNGVCIDVEPTDMGVSIVHDDGGYNPLSYTASCAQFNVFAVHQFVNLYNITLYISSYTGIMMDISYIPLYDIRFYMPFITDIIEIKNNSVQYNNLMLQYNNSTVDINMTCDNENMLYVPTNMYDSSYHVKLHDGTIFNDVEIHVTDDILNPYICITNKMLDFIVTADKMYTVVVPPDNRLHRTIYIDVVSMVLALWIVHIYINFTSRKNIYSCIDITVGLNISVLLWVIVFIVIVLTMPGIDDFMLMYNIMFGLLNDGALRLYKYLVVISILIATVLPIIIIMASNLNYQSSYNRLGMRIIILCFIFLFTYLVQITRMPFVPISNVIWFVYTIFTFISVITIWHVLLDDLLTHDVETATHTLCVRVLYQFLSIHFIYMLLIDSILPLMYTITLLIPIWNQVLFLIFNITMFISFYRFIVTHKYFKFMF